ncbi:PREDICTED: salutaridinol 7-O-acetyltransferase-like [Prunus mume]|uniref:Salutaridinol 7-O-acetyltransferase-like n=1 Tax=Prunus mume TaxID=102107 RepID=A0ABM1LHY7_PRUMU|nr:PREDICTED: salutaridinol 7-O-acetyltransferase-like [Prunus mume]
MEVEIISKEKIKPSCPTPSHLRIFKLSLLDQLIPAPYAPVILFYHPPINENDDDNINSRLHLLKTSLAETLTGFYPLAGEIKDDLSIDCNDQGAHYVEARVNYSSLDEFLSRPDLLLLLHRFLPCDVTTAGASVTNIQVNVFKCGGIAIGLCISHKILDGAALCTFLKSWTAIAHSDSDDHQTEDATTYASVASSIIGGPNLFAATRLFPTNDELWLRDSSIPMWGSLFIKDGKSSCVTKRFVFDASAIANLKDMAKSSSSCVQVLKRGPTRVEVVSAFIWQCAMAASKQKYGFQRPSVLTHTVNLRSRIFLDDAYEAAAASDTAAAADLNLENSIGNLLWIAAARCPTVMLDEEEEMVVVATNNNNNSSASGSRILHGLVSELRNALSKVDGGFVKKMRSGEEGNGSKPAKAGLLALGDQLKNAMSV